MALLVKGTSRPTRVTTPTGRSAIRHPEDVTCPGCKGEGYTGLKFYADECDPCEGKGFIDPVYLQDLIDSGEYPTTWHEDS
jgi:DnaJ-class molecular chaperone